MRQGFEISALLKSHPPPTTSSSIGDGSLILRAVAGADQFRQTVMRRFSGQTIAKWQNVRMPDRRRAPNANAYAERFVRAIKEECLDRLILIVERHFRRAVTEFVEHYHRERNH